MRNQNQNPPSVAAVRRRFLGSFPLGQYKHTLLAFFFSSSSLPAPSSFFSALPPDVTGSFLSPSDLGEGGVRGGEGVCDHTHPAQEAHSQRVVPLGEGAPAAIILALCMPEATTLPSPPLSSPPHPCLSSGIRGPPACILGWAVGHFPRKPSRSLSFKEFFF